MMVKVQSARIQDLVGLLHGLYPPDLAEEWDSVGLHVGDPAAEVKSVMVALDPSEAALEQAHRHDCQALLTHHPLLLRPLRTVTPTDEAGRIVISAIRHDIALLAAHTNLDSAKPGLNDWLAQRLGLSDVEPLSVAQTELVKFVVFVPQGHVDAVSEAMFSAGAGHVGDYDRCSFRVEGVGTFRPGESTSPFSGTPGKDEQAAEVRVETILPRRLAGRVLDKVRRAHPYEEMAFDLYPLHNRLEHAGLGRIGVLRDEVSLEAYAATVKDALGAMAVRVTGDLQRTVRRVAVCGGSGASLLGSADRQGVDVLVTGDIKYHEARQAEQRGVAVIDAGHFATEQLAVAGLCDALAREADRRGLNIAFRPVEGERDPFFNV